MENRVQGLYESTVDQAVGVIKSQPVGAVVAAVGLGVVAGMFVVSMFPQSSRRNDWSATEIGRRVMDRLGSLTPSSWSS
jgi:hypothetical protein